MITYIIIGLTVFISYIAFSNDNIIRKGIFSPYIIDKEKDWKRFVTHGFLHADINHLVFNMISLYFFGPFVEKSFGYQFNEMGSFVYLFFYITSIIAASIFGFFKNKSNQRYLSLGASGAISAVVFASIIFDPINKIYIFFIPIGIPAYIFGPVYLLISGFLAKKGGGGIAHDAHFFGALYGMLFIIIAFPGAIANFIKMIANQ
jgi:membrane associated rhomboid family serine protease